jgi:hypothetical protein
MKTPIKIFKLDTAIMNVPKDFWKGQGKEMSDAMFWDSENAQIEGFRLVAS